MVEYRQEIEDPAKGKLRYLRPFIVLVPTLIVCIFNIYANIPLLDAMWRLLGTIVFFYLVGSVAQGIIRRMLLQSAKEPEEKDEETEEETEEDEENKESEEAQD